jgi:hypothetical protein
MSKHYTIEIQGHLDREWSDQLYGLRVTHREEDTPTSTLYGALDQAALLGVLSRLHDLNIAILTVRCDAYGELTTFPLERRLGAVDP